jgi:hypothetical protein
MLCYQSDMNIILATYIIFSLAVGLMDTLYHLCAKAESTWNNKSDDRQEFLDKLVQKGHLQKSIHGERVVFHENDIVGEGSVRATDILLRLKQNNRIVYCLLLLVVGTASTAVTWPRDLYQWTKRK